MQFITLYLVFAMAATLWLDVTRYKIPNWLVGSLLLLYPVAVYFAPAAIDWKMALVGMLIIFAVGSITFVMNWMKAGDIKLIAVLALWVGFDGLLEFVILFSLIGGIFTLFVLVVRKGQYYLPWKPIFKKPKIFEDVKIIPYGVAIASAFLWMMWQGKIALAMIS